MLRSHPRGKTKVDESIRTEPTDKRSVFPSEKPVDTMNFPYKFILLMTIVSSIVLLLLCGHSGAAPAFPHKNCTSDYECDQGEYCRQKFGASYCVPCLDCNRYNRESSRSCASSRTDCGPCLPGFGELGPHCSRLVKENVTSNATDRIVKKELGAKGDQSGDSGIWLVVCVAATLAAVVIIMVIGVLFYTRRRGAGRDLVATEGPEEQDRLVPMRPSAPVLLPENADSFESLESWANPYFRKSSKSIRRVHCEPPAENRAITTDHNLLQQSSSCHRVVAQCDYGDNYNNHNAPAVDDGNNEGHEVLLGLLENAINQQVEPNPQGQVPNNDINNGNELNEDSVDFEQDAGSDNSGHPNAIDADHENLDGMNNYNNNDHIMDMVDNNVPNAPQDLPEEEPQFEMEIDPEIDAFLRAPSPDVRDDDPMDAVGPEADQIVPDFPLVDNSDQNPFSGPQDPQQLDEEIHEMYDVEMPVNAEEENFPQQENQQ